MATFWKDTIDFIVNNMGSDLFSQSANLISHLAPLFSIGFGIYFMIIILNAYGRGFDGNAVDFAKKTVAWLIIIMCAFNAAQYQKIANMLYEFPEFLSHSFNNNQDFDASALDTAWDAIIQVVANIMYSVSKLPISLSSLGDAIMLYASALIVIALGVAFFGIVVAYYAIAKVSLAMVLLIGPLFLGMMLFPSTRQYAMNWIGQIFNYSVTVALFTLLMTFQMKFFDNHIKVALSMGGNGTILSIISPAQIFGILPLFTASTMIFIIVALNIPSIASALTGGAGAGGFSNMVNLVNNTLNGGAKNAFGGGAMGYSARKSRALLNRFNKNKISSTK